MTTTILSHAGQAAGEARGRSLFARMMDALITARQRQVNYQIAGYLAQYDDRTLAELGITRQEIAAWRSRISC